MKNRSTKTTTITPIEKNVAYAEAMVNSVKMATQEGIAEATGDMYNKNTFKNNTVDLFNRKKYDISREFDGREVEGTMMERPTLGGGKMVVENFNNMPGGGSHTQRTRFNSEGMPVKRTIKDKKINPRG
jgi:hypothetical protein